MDPLTIALAGLVLSGIGVGANTLFGLKSNEIQEQSLTETMKSNYNSYEQTLQGMIGDNLQNQLAIDQSMEDIASQRSYLDRWKDEYDLSMQNTVDEGFAQYQQMASNLGTGLVSAGETGARGGSAALLNAGASSTLRNLTGREQGFGTTGRLSLMFGASALDMLADKQTAMSSIDIGYRGIDSYRTAIDEMGGAIKSMEETNGDLQKTIKKRETKSALQKAMGVITL